MLPVCLPSNYPAIPGDNSKILLFRHAFYRIILHIIKIITAILLLSLLLKLYVLEDSTSIPSIAQRSIFSAIYFRTEMRSSLADCTADKLSLILI